MSLDVLRAADPEVYEAIASEVRRQQDGLELIASENFVSDAVLEAAGCVMTNKYAEGYPGRRYYGGCECVDVVENLAIERAKKLFGAEHVNVQPHSGSQANMGVYFAVLDPGDTIVAMRLDSGGHLTHGSPVNFSGRMYKIVPYGVSRETGRVDYDELARIVAEAKPKLLVGGWSAYPRQLDFARMRAIADSVGALFMVDMAHFAGLVAAGEHPSPVPHAHFVTTTTHKTLRGTRGGIILCKAEHAKLLDSRVMPGIQGGPLMHIIAAKAVAFGEALKPGFAEYQRQILKNARALGEGLQKRGFDLVTGGTDVHLLLLDLRSKNITGKDAEEACGRGGITVNRNTIPFDERKPFIASGVRVGTPAVTTRGMKEPEMLEIARLLADVVERPDDAAVATRVRAEVLALCRRFPLYPRMLSA